MPNQYLERYAARLRIEAAFHYSLNVDMPYDCERMMDQYQIRLDWLERQLAEVAAFVERDTKLLSETPDSRSLQVALRSWQDHHRELTSELHALKIKIGLDASASR